MRKKEFKRLLKIMTGCVIQHNGWKKFKCRGCKKITTYFTDIREDKVHTCAKCISEGVWNA